MVLLTNEVLEFTKRLRSRAFVISDGEGGRPIAMVSIDGGMGTD